VPVTILLLLPDNTEKELIVLKATIEGQYELEKEGSTLYQFVTVEEPELFSKYEVKMISMCYYLQMLDIINYGRDKLKKVLIMTQKKFNYLMNGMENFLEEFLLTLMFFIHFIKIIHSVFLLIQSNFDVFFMMDIENTMSIINIL
jgi:hypothetical protein